MSVNTAAEQELLRAPTMPQQRTCCVCGKHRESMHHVVPRSRGGHKGPQLPLCGSGTTGCHGMAHDEGTDRLVFAYDPLDGVWRWAVYRGKQFIREGKCRTDDDWLAIDAPADSPPQVSDEQQFGQLVHDVSREMDADIEAWTKAWLRNAMRVVLVEQRAVEMFGARKGRSLTREWRRSKGVADATASRMRAIIEYVPFDADAELQTVGTRRLHALALAIKAEAAPVADLIADCLALSQSDFEARWLAKEPEPKAEKQLVCPHCGCHGAAGEFAEVA